MGAAQANQANMANMAATRPPPAGCARRTLLSSLVALLVLSCCLHSLAMKLSSSFASGVAGLWYAAGVRGTASNTTTLLPLTFTPLALGSITPSGWLADQLALSAAGLAGHEHDFYPYVADSSWLGGSSEYSELNEGFPYWLNGLVSLAYATGDARLKDQVSDAVTYVLAHQADDGWLGPETGRARNLWARYPLLLGLVQLVEAEPQTWEEPIMAAIGKFVGLMLSMLQNNGTGYLWHEGDTLSEDDTTWGRVRVQDLLITLQWIWEREDTTDAMRATLGESMRLLIDGSINWADWWRDGAFIKEDLNFLTTEGSDGPRYPYEHGVNAGQGLKALAVFRRYTHNDSLVDITRRGVQWTFQYHGAASGAILADERLAGLAPYYGSETCTLVETMYSLSYLYQAIGDNSFADRAELIAFNALPAQLSPNWWARQYVGQPNQGYSKQLPENPFFNVNNVGQTYGVEVDYPCCTVNHPQGLPKFLAASFVKVGDNGLAHALLSPASVTTTLASGKVIIECSTNYPFSTTLTYTITSGSAFTFHVRVPTWTSASSSTLTVNGTSQTLSPDSQTGLHALPLPAGSTNITYTLSAPLTTHARANDTLTVQRGALIYALSIPSTNTSHPAKQYSNTSADLAGAPASAVDWTLLNASAWNVAVDPSTFAFRSLLDNSTTTAELANPLFMPLAPPVWIEAQGCEIGGWGTYRGVMDVPPPASERRCTGVTQTYRLEPLGAAKLRLTDLATISLVRRGLWGLVGP